MQVHPVLLNRPKKLEGPFFFAVCNRVCSFGPKKLGHNHISPADEHRKQQKLTNTGSNKSGSGNWIFGEKKLFGFFIDNARMDNRNHHYWNGNFNLHSFIFRFYSINLHSLLSSSFFIFFFTDQFLQRLPTILEASKSEFRIIKFRNQKVQNQNSEIRNKKLQKSKSYSLRFRNQRYNTKLKL